MLQLLKEIGDIVEIGDINSNEYECAIECSIWVSWSNNYKWHGIKYKQRDIVGQ